MYPDLRLFRAGSTINVYNALTNIAKVDSLMKNEENMPTYDPTIYNLVFLLANHNILISIHRNAQGLIVDENSRLRGKGKSLSF